MPTEPVMRPTRSASPVPFDVVDIHRLPYKGRISYQALLKWNIGLNAVDHHLLKSATHSG